MKYGLIGEKLGHSFSKEIHEKLAGYEYELREIPKGELDGFMRKHDFLAINVTIPYKQDVIPYLDFISDKAKAIGAVNTIVNKDGKLYGYNTDFAGMKAIFDRIKVDIKNKKVLIAGTGGTSKTAYAVAKALGASEIFKLSRNPKGDSITYEEAYEKHSDAHVIINTTPCGMYPDNGGLPIDPSLFKKLEGAVDAIYNPLRTNFILRARANGVPAEGGLYMLVAQAVAASELFTGVTYPEGTADKVYGEILKEKENIVLSGMPGCGKSTIGRLLAEDLGRRFADLDDEIVKYCGKPIPDIFAEGGESLFRDMETKVLGEKAAPLSSAVIATGGGAILRDENISMLKQNGRIYFLDRPLEQLMPTSDRPLASSPEAITKRYNERYPRYCTVSDVHLKTDGIAEHAVAEIRKDFT